MARHRHQPFERKRIVGIDDRMQISRRVQCVDRRKQRLHGFPPPGPIGSLRRPKAVARNALRKSANLPKLILIPAIGYCVRPLSCPGKRAWLPCWYREPAGQRRASTLRGDPPFELKLGGGEWIRLPSRGHAASMTSCWIGKSRHSIVWTPTANGRRSP